MNDNQPGPFDHRLVAGQPVTLFRTPDHPERDYEPRTPFEPEPRPTVRSVLAEMGWRDAIIVAVLFMLVGAYAYGIAVACGVAG